MIYDGENGVKIRTKIKKVIQSGKRILTVQSGTKTRQAWNKMIYDKYKRDEKNCDKKGPKLRDNEEKIEDYYSLMTLIIIVNIVIIIIKSSSSSSLVLSWCLRL